MEEIISLKEIFEILKKHVTSIIISMFAGLALAGLITFFIITPKYSSQAQLIVTLPQTENANANDVNTNLQMINTYKDLITSDLVMNQVKDTLDSEYDLKLSVETIKSSIEVTQSQNSQMFSIKANSTKAIDAEHIANTTSQVFQENAKDTMAVDKISIISKATASMTPVSPNNKLNLAIGLILGLMVGVGLAFLLELFDRTVNLYDIIIFDMPPVVAVTDAQIMASKADGTILVIRENVSRKESLTKAKKLLHMVQAKVLGVVYNCAENTKDQGYYYCYGN
ncbi:Wzz/FepE/Etk N-terminal domain-containing protein [Enterococcus dongliensis]|uniref:Wzz/FepE/Etk N-terminal domain-containing protein n=1 Tax=Enterococcus dongliensis TaxID=2559925 RepID=UPI0035E2F8D0